MVADTVLVAGATGSLGRAVCRALASRGAKVRALVRRPSSNVEHAYAHVLGDGLQPETLGPAVDGVTTVFSCMGAPIMPTLSGGRAGFEAVDTVGNLNLLGAAERAGVKRFVYVSVAGGEGSLADLAYVRAHERVVQGLRASTVNHAVVRPTGFFSAFEAFLSIARWGPVPVLGNPEARTNPIAVDDLAEVCSDAVEDPSFGEQEVGGPQVLTRRDIAHLARRVVGKSERSVRVPAALVSAWARCLGLVHPRLGQAMAFFVRVGQLDCVAPRHGSTRLDDWLTHTARPPSRSG